MDETVPGVDFSALGYVDDLRNKTRRERMPGLLFCKKVFGNHRRTIRATVGNTYNLAQAVTPVELFKYGLFKE